MYSEENLLIITKTYPLPSQQYQEHACVAAINEQGALRRLFPVPFRLLSEEKQFTRWQWINARVEKASDKRVESYRIDIDSIIIKTTKRIDWTARMHYLKPHTFTSFNKLEEARISKKQSLGLIKPIDYELIIEEDKEKDWSKKEIEKLTREGLFESKSIKNRPRLKKLPYKFYYQYKILENGQLVNYKNLITDWEVGMLFWNCSRDNAIDWEMKLRKKLEVQFKDNNDLYFLMGTMHRFPDQWLIVGLVYPPKIIQAQEMLFPPEINV